MASFRSVAVTSADPTALTSSRVNTPVPAASSSTRSDEPLDTRPARSTANGRNTVGTSHRSYASGIESAHSRSLSSETITKLRGRGREWPAKGANRVHKGGRTKQRLRTLLEVEN